MPSFWPLFDRDLAVNDEQRSGKDKSDHNLIDRPRWSRDPKAVDPDDGHSNLDPDGRGDQGGRGIFWFGPARWLRSPMLGNPDLPTRATWIAVFAVCQTAMSWIGGRVW